MASSSSSFRSAPASSSRSCKYDVFLSFRGEDTRKIFVDHLYTALEKHLIHTYKDDENLPRGESIGPSLMTAIEESHTVVIVFSTRYADSSWCLEELAHIIKCKNERGLIVMPIFYDLEPSEVRKQTGDFGKGFAEQVMKNNTKLESWKKALVDASEISGWEVKKTANRHESKVIKEIVDTIFRGLFSSNSHIDENLVGMTRRLQDLASLLEIGLDGVRMVGIWGIGGGGKTTLATYVYTEISHHFEGHCILENIREKSSKDGLEKLQMNILSAVFNKEVKVSGIIDGKNKIKNMLCHRKVLIVLDDVHKLEQLEALAGSPNWFGNESRIIITTRDKHLLETHRVDNVCHLTLLSDQEAIQLFNKYACNEKKPIKDYDKLSLDVVSYAAGLPLAIKVLGSFLYDKDEKEWMSAVDRLKDIPEEEILEMLRISYDGLKTDEQELFLDIACFFRGHYASKKDHFDNAIEILEACYFHLEIGIKVLRQKALINIDVNGEFEMHDLVQEMAYYIVRGEQPNTPRNHSRIWKKETVDMCLVDATKENYKIEAIPYYSYVHCNYPPSQFCKFVSNMKRLRWLSVISMGNDQNFLASLLYKSGPNFLSNELRYISWHYYPGISFPNSFQAMNLVVLKLKDSLQKKLWKSYKSLPHLKVLELSSMTNLLHTPDFDGLPCLQKLTLIYCYKLKEIHPSLGNHTSLEYVSVAHCWKLKNFPTIVCMDKLQTLDVEYCPYIHVFPDIRANMKSLVNLSLKHVGIKVLPSSIAKRCTNLSSLNLRSLSKLRSVEFNFEALKFLEEFIYESMPPHTCITMFYQFPRSLRKVDLSWCGIKDGYILYGIAVLSNLEELDLSMNGFSRLNFSLLQLTRLKLLRLKHCFALVELPKLPSNLAFLIADHCHSLKGVGDSLTNCKWLRQVSNLKGSIINDGDRLLESMLEGNGIENGSMVVHIQGVKIAKEFIAAGLWGGRRSCTLQLPNNWCNEFSGFLICAVLSKRVMIGWMDVLDIRMKEVIGSGMGGSQDDNYDIDNDVVWKEGEWTWLGYVSFGSLNRTSWWDQTHTTLSFSLEDYTGRMYCSGFGVRLVDRKSGPTSTASSQFSDDQNSVYTPDFKIRHDSMRALKFSLGMRSTKSSYL